MRLIIDIDPRYCEDMQSDVKELYYEAINRITEAVRNGKPYEERSHDEFVKLLKDRIERSVCKYCQMNKHCELCEISRVFMIIDLTDIDIKGGAE